MTLGRTGNVVINWDNSGYRYPADATVWGDSPHIKRGDTVRIKRDESFAVGDKVFRWVGAETFPNYDSNSTYKVGDVLYKPNEYNLYVVTHPKAGDYPKFPTDYDAVDQHFENPTSWQNRYVYIGYLDDYYPLIKFSVKSWGSITRIYKYTFKKSMRFVNLKIDALTYDTSKAIFEPNERYLEGTLGGSAYLVEDGKRLKVPCNNNFKLNEVYFMDSDTAVMAVEDKGSNHFSYINVSVNSIDVGDIKTSLEASADEREANLSNGYIVPSEIIIENLGYSCRMYTRTNVYKAIETVHCDTPTIKEIKNYTDAPESNDYKAVPIQSIEKNKPFDGHSKTVLKDHADVTYFDMYITYANMLYLTNILADTARVLRKTLTDTNYVSFEDDPNDDSDDDFLYLHSSVAGESGFLVDSDGDRLNDMVSFDIEHYLRRVYTLETNPDIRILFDLKSGTTLSPYPYCDFRNGVTIDTENKDILTYGEFYGDLRVVFESESANIEVGEIIFANSKNLGNTNLKFTNSYKDYSPREEDQWGNVFYKKGVVKKVFEGSADFPIEKYDETTDAFAKIAGDRIIFDGNDNELNLPLDSISRFSSAVMIGRVSAIKQATTVINGEISKYSSYSFTLTEDV